MPHTPRESNSRGQMYHYPHPGIVAMDSDIQDGETETNRSEHDERPRWRDCRNVGGGAT